MSFTVTRLEVSGFRSYDHYVLEPDPCLTVLVGPNAVGKTNLIEALQLMTEGDSFRRPVWAEVVGWGQTRAELRLDAVDAQRCHRAELLVTESGRRTYKVNGKTKRSVSDISGIIPCVMFTPEDLRVVKDSAEKRRSLLDGIGSQLSKSYGHLRAEYEKVVRQRNALLRSDDVGDEVLAPWDERLVSLGARLVSHRLGLFDRLMAAASSVYETIADDGPLTARYLPSWARDGVAEATAEPSEALERHLTQRKAEERARRATLAGPHRDEVVFEIAGREARVFSSQGQQRTIALALKLAEVAVVTDVSGARPVLLLDDVMSELDEARRTALTALVGDSAQTVMTTTNLGYFTDELIGRAKVVALP